MGRPCDICVDPTCGGRMSCNCDTCGKRDCCPRRLGLKPLVRITRRCTQRCSHCCFSCGPKERDDMSVEMAGMVSRFCRSNGITRMEAMGGEFFLHPEWEQVLGTIGEGMRLARLVTNGDWAGRPRIAARVLDFLKAHDQWYVGVSRDRWHTNRHVDRAVAMLGEAGVLFRVATGEETTDMSIVPVGRSQGSFGFYSMTGWCRNPEKKYTFLVDEAGRVHKCGFGAWPYANVADYVDGGFAAEFKSFNSTFYGIGGLGCESCRRAEARRGRRDFG